MYERCTLLLSVTSQEKSKFLFQYFQVFKHFLAVLYVAVYSLHISCLPITPGENKHTPIVLHKDKRNIFRSDCLDLNPTFFNVQSLDFTFLSILIYKMKAIIIIDNISFSEVHY